MDLCIFSVSSSQPSTEFSTTAVLDGRLLLVPTGDVEVGLVDSCIFLT